MSGSLTDILDLWTPFSEADDVPDVDPPDPDPVPGSCSGLTGLLSLWPPFCGAEDDEEPEPEPTEDFRTALRNRLLAADGLESLEGRIYWAKTGPAPFPNMRILPVGPDRKEENTSNSYPFRRTLQFSILSTDDVECEELATAAYEALAWAASEPLLFVGGYEIARFPDDLWLPREPSGDGPGGSDIWHAHFDVEFLLGRG